MLDYHDLELLELIKIKINNKYYKIQDFLNENKISKGCFYYHLNHINNFLFSKYKIKLNVLKTEKEEFIKIYKIISETSDIFMNSIAQLIVYIIFLLLNPQSKINNFTNLLKISNSNVFKNINKLNNIFENYCNTEKNKIKIKNKKGGYYIEAGELEIRKIIINVSIYINNYSETKNLLLNYIFTKMNKKINKNDYDKIIQILLEYNEFILLSNLDINTYALIIFLLINTSEYYFSKEKEFNLFNFLNIDNNIKFSKSYIIASKIIDKIEFNLNYNFKSKKNEIEQLALLLFNINDVKKNNIIINKKEEELKTIKIFIKNMLKKINMIGYKIDYKYVKKELILYTIFLKKNWNFYWINDNTLNLKKDFINSKLEYLELYNFCKNYLNKIININLNNNNNRYYYEFTIILISYITKWPNYINNNNIKLLKKMILVTNLSGNLINLLKAKINETYFNYKIIKILTIKKYNLNKNKNKYKNITILSDNENFAKENNCIYFNLNNIFENILKTLKINNLSKIYIKNLDNTKNLIKKILDTNLVSYHNKIEIISKLIIWK